MLYRQVRTELLGSGISFGTWSLIEIGEIHYGFVFTLKSLPQLKDFSRLFFESLGWVLRCLRLERTQKELEKMTDEWKGPHKLLSERE